MKKFPYSFPEFGFILLVILLPLAVSLIWQSATVWGYVGKIAGSMIIGFLFWLGIIIIVCRKYDQKRQNEKKKA
jgi:hypothetical protein